MFGRRFGSSYGHVASIGIDVHRGLVLFGLSRGTASSNGLVVTMAVTVHGGDADGATVRDPVD